MSKKSLPEQIKKVAESPPQQLEQPIILDQLISTGSLLLDLAISGGVAKYGGLPGRIIAQVYGANSTGKTTLMAEALGFAQRAGGQWRVRDPEGRLNENYCRTFGVKLNQDEVERTGTISDIFESLIGPLETKKVGSSTITKRNVEKAWKPDPAKVNIYAVDSLSALASGMEKEQGDKRGQKRAWDFSQGFRLVSDHIYEHNIIMFCTDQIREKGTTPMGTPITGTSGGRAIGFYASLRIGLRKVGELTKEVQLPGMSKAEKHVYGIEVEATITKSSVDRPFRTAPLRLIFNYGYDDIGANLQWLKAHGAMTEHPTDPSKQAVGYVIGDKYFPLNTPGGALDAAIRYVEENNLEEDVREWVVDVWNQIEEQVKPSRKEKMR
jgi:RecA/RadA recombinase